MHTITLDNSIPRTYKNNGQHAEQVFRYTLTGRIISADNIPHDIEADVLDYQVKSPRCTVCTGTYDIAAYVRNDAAHRFAFVNKACSVAYIMTAAEWIEFASRFCYKSQESGGKNGDAVKVRLLDESARMREYLNRQPQPGRPLRWAPNRKIFEKSIDKPGLLCYNRLR